MPSKSVSWMTERPNKQVLMELKLYLAAFFFLNKGWTLFGIFIFYYIKKKKV